jgi:hypothetical protein
VEKEIAKLEQRVVKLAVEADVPNAEVLVDDISVGVTPLGEPLVVNSGTRRITVRHPDHPPQSRQLTVVGGSLEKVAFTFKVKAAAPTSGPIARDVAPSSSPVTASAPSSNLASDPVSAPSFAQKGAPDAAANRSRVPWLTWTLSGALAAGAATMGVLTLSKNDSLSKERERVGADPNALASDAANVRRLAIVTDGLIVAAVATGALSLWLTIDSPNAKARGSADHEPMALGLGLNGVTLRSRF